jgi:hypothetical protein
MTVPTIECFNISFVVVAKYPAASLVTYLDKSIVVTLIATRCHKQGKIVLNQLSCKKCKNINRGIQYLKDD